MKGCLSGVCLGGVGHDGGEGRGKDGAGEGGEEAICSDEEGNCPLFLVGPVLDLLAAL